MSEQAQQGSNKVVFGFFERRIKIELRSRFRVDVVQNVVDRDRRLHQKNILYCLEDVDLLLENEFVDLRIDGAVTCCAHIQEERSEQLVLVQPVERFSGYKVDSNHEGREVFQR